MGTHIAALFEEYCQRRQEYTQATDPPTRTRLWLELMSLLEQIEGLEEQRRRQRSELREEAGR
jgi:hypothetical protein